MINLRTYENFHDTFEEEVLKLYDYLHFVVEKDFDGGKYLVKEINNNDKWETYSIVLNTYHSHFIYQIDYKSDGMWIKRTINTNRLLLKELKNLDIFFDSIAKYKSEFGWCFDRDTFLLKFKEMELYIEAGKFNL